MLKADVVIIGGGLAGASAFYHLSRSARVLLLEAEVSPGLHATSQNAAMVRRLVKDPVLARMAREGAAFLETPPEDLSAALWDMGLPPSCVRRTGSLLVAKTEDGAESLLEMIREGREAGLDAQWLGPEEVTIRFPLIRRGGVSGGAWCTEDGVADPQAMLAAFLRAGTKLGSRCQFGARVTGIETTAGQARVLLTTVGPVECSTVVIAAGAWAAPVGASLQVSEVPLTPFRRHIAVSGPMPLIEGWPFIWDIEREFYVRPETGRALYSACDRTASTPCAPEVDPSVHIRMAEKAHELMPGLPLDVATTWAGLRTYPPDGRFVIGADPAQRGIYWLAGLGGHGVTVCGAAGRVLADAVTDGVGEADFSVNRFIPLASGV